MKQIKKVTALALVITLFFSGVTTANAVAPSSADKLHELGLLLDATDKGLAMNINRALGLTMVLKAIGYTQEDANKKADQSTFTDMKGYEWAAGFAAIGKEVGITTGADATGTKFAPSRTMTKKEFITFMLRVIGYEGKDAWDMTGTLGKKAGLINSTNVEDNNFIKNEAAEIMFNALKAKMQKGKSQRLVDHLIDEKKVSRGKAMAVGLIEAPKSLELVDVRADNLRQITLVFNKPVNQDSAEKLTNYRLKGRTLGSAKLADDKTVLLTVGTGSSPVVLENARDAELTVQNIRAITGETLTKTTKTFRALDQQSPQVEAVEITGPKSFKITFAEPMKKADRANVKVTLDGSTRTVRSANIDRADERTVQVMMYANFVEDKTYTVEVIGVEDYAGYKTTIYTTDLTYAPDKSSPVAEVVSANQKEVVVQFNKPVKGVTAKHFYHTYSSWTAKEVYADAEHRKKVSTNDLVSKVWVAFAEGTSSNDKPLSGKDIEFTVRSKNQNGVYIKDAWDNKLEQQSFKVSVTADKEAPTISSIEVKAGNKLLITYNEPLSTAGIYRLLDTNGKRVASASATYNGRQVTVILGSNQEGKTRVLEIKGVKDNSLNKNELALTTETVVFNDSTFEGVNRVSSKIERSSGKIVGGKIFVTYAEDVTSSANEKDNYVIEYRVSNRAKPSIEPYFYEGSRTVVIELTKEEATTLNDNSSTAKLYISGIEDLQGNKMFAEVKAINATQQATAVEKVSLIEPNKIEVKFDSKITECGSADTFGLSGTVFANGYEYAKLTGETVKIIDAYVNDTENAVILTLNHDVYSVEGARVVINSTSAKDIFNNPVTASTQDIKADKVAPKVKKYANAPNEDREQVVAKKVGSEYIVEITYTEKIDTAALSKLTYSVSSDFEVEGASSNGEVVTIKVQPRQEDGKVVANFSADVVVTQNSAIEDMARNQKASGDSYTAIKDSSWK